MLVALVVSVVIIEGAFRPDLGWRPLVTAVTVALAFTLPWRRAHPMAVIVVAFGTLAVIDGAAAVMGAEPVGLWPGWAGERSPSATTGPSCRSWLGAPVALPKGWESLPS